MNYLLGSIQEKSDKVSHTSSLDILDGVFYTKIKLVDTSNPHNNISQRQHPSCVMLYKLCQRLFLSQPFTFKSCAAELFRTLILKLVC